MYTYIYENCFLTGVWMTWNHPENWNHPVCALRLFWKFSTFLLCGFFLFFFVNSLIYKWQSKYMKGVSTCMNHAGKIIYRCSTLHTVSLQDWVYNLPESKKKYPATAPLWWKLKYERMWTELFNMWIHRKWTI